MSPLWPLLSFSQPWRSKWKNSEQHGRYSKSRAVSMHLSCWGMRFCLQPTLWGAAVMSPRDERKINMYGNLVWCPWDCGGKITLHVITVSQGGLPPATKGISVSTQSLKKRNDGFNGETDISILYLSLSSLASKIPPHPPAPTPIIIAHVSWYSAKKWIWVGERNYWLK